MKLSQALVDVGATAAQAAEARNVDALFNVGEHIDNACEECHRLYAYEDAPRRKR